MLLRVIDIETTGTSPSEVIEIAAVDVIRSGGRWTAGPPRSRLFRPSGEISVHAMAIHHLTLADLDAALGPATDEAIAEFVLQAPAPDVLVAHNADFERRHLGRATGALPWLCTVKAARELWPGAPGYGNQVLRYWRRLELDPALAMPAHRAAPDAWVTAHILIDLLQCGGALLDGAGLSAGPLALGRAA
ncbi:exonuclease domain-containing protein [Caulobacter sp. KR2-114]|uniref:exonuclease domain-containing protein n=1 Tax=Caulobacter sp. KR2-114 TaxID=3400912 RepID=UPI003BFA9570